MAIASYHFLEDRLVEETASIVQPFNCIAVWEPSDSVRMSSLFLIFAYLFIGETSKNSFSLFCSRRAFSCQFFGTFSGSKTQITP